MLKWFSLFCSFLLMPQLLKCKFCRLLDDFQFSKEYFDKFLMYCKGKRVCDLRKWEILFFKKANVPFFRAPIVNFPLSQKRIFWYLQARVE
jgi:hypothetical protein